MSQPPINPLKNMKIDYWYKALTVVGAALFVFNGTSFFDRYPVVPLGFLSSGIFFIGLGEWINHPLKVRFIGLNRPGFPGECFICELRLPDHRFRWKHNKLFLLLPEEYGPAFP
ncbi:hypothetical protein, partial [Escherichia coli]|uniref:hypothetical protein n=4 Tax=Escherichia coli TaxID=562 RepID=UPI0018272C5E